MQHRTPRALVAALGLLGLSGCNIPLTADSVRPISLVLPGAGVSQEIRTAATGEIILAQSLGHPGYLRLENTVAPTDRVWQGIVTFHPKMEQGLLLYPAQRVGKARNMVACSLEAVTTTTGGLAEHPPTPVCFDLPDGALLPVPPGAPKPADATLVGGSFYLKAGAAARSGFVYAGLAGEFANGVQGQAFMLNEPARLAVAQAPAGAAEPTLKIALRYSADAMGPRLQTIYLSGDQQLETRTPDVPFPANGPFPRTVQVSGAAIEILAITNGVLAYRVTRNFASDRPLFTDLPD